MRAVSDSIWRRAAPELAASRSASRRSWFRASMCWVWVCEFGGELGGAEVGRGEALLEGGELGVELFELALEGEGAAGARRGRR